MWWLTITGAAWIMLGFYAFKQPSRHGEKWRAGAAGIMVVIGGVQLGIGLATLAGHALWTWAMGGAS